ncbi:MAG: hypothetical protein Q9201_006492 [Fulgogasparrea decipioides]
MIPGTELPGRPLDILVVEYTSSGELLGRQDLSTTAGLWQHSGILCRRYEIHNALKSAAVAAEGAGPPANLKPSSQVVEVIPESATLIFEDGSTMTGDLVIGADGIKSVARNRLHDVKPFPSGKSAYRFLVDREKALNNPKLGDIIQRDGEFSIWYGADRRVWLYTTHFNRLLNFVCMHPDSLSEPPDANDAFGSSQNVHHNKSRMMEIFKDFDSRLVCLLDMAEPSSVRLWKLLDMDPPPIRHKGRLCLVGDAALPFLPHIGQGAACALEDAASITTLIGPGVQESDIPERLKLYEECRKSRAENLHSFSRLLGRDLEAGNEDAKLNRELMAKKFFPYIFAHDEFDHSAQKLRELEYRKTPALWSMPVSFGPTARVGRSTRQQAADGAASDISSTIKFKTSRTLLQNLLPNGSVSFATVGSIALASYTHTLHSNVDWLAGQSYNELSFYIHSVQSEARNNGSHPNSDFLVVSFVDSADVLIRGREHPGIPMVFCNFSISSHDRGSHREITALWNTKVILKMEFTTREMDENGTEMEMEPVVPGPVADVLTHRYVPGIGGPDAVPAVDSIICLRRRGAEQAVTRRKRTCTDSALHVISHSPKDLPTLHHILERLAELPVLEIVDGYIVEGMGSHAFDQIGEPVSAV